MWKLRPLEDTDYDDEDFEELADESEDFDNDPDDVLSYDPTDDLYHEEI